MLSDGRTGSREINIANISTLCSNPPLAFRTGNTIQSKHQQDKFLYQVDYQRTFIVISMTMGATENTTGENRLHALWAACTVIVHVGVLTWHRSHPICRYETIALCSRWSGTCVWEWGVALGGVPPSYHSSNTPSPHVRSWHHWRKKKVTCKLCVCVCVCVTHFSLQSFSTWGTRTCNSLSTVFRGSFCFQLRTCQEKVCVLNKGLCSPLTLHLPWLLWYTCTLHTPCQIYA